MKLSVALADCLAAAEAAVLVRIERTAGSTPREAGAMMMVTSGGAKGTIGGGALEMEAILEARRMLATGGVRHDMNIPLGPAIGQCCGGRVELSLQALDRQVVAEVMEAEAAFERAAAPVFVFGAGHTGRALACALSPLPFAVHVVDTRASLVAELPETVRGHVCAMPETIVETAPQGAAYIVATHDHALDFHIAAAALLRHDSPYVGMIGSATKKERFHRYLHERGMETEFDRLILPIGGRAVYDKRPEVIAALVAYELLIAIFGEGARKSTAQALHMIISGA